MLPIDTGSLCEFQCACSGEEIKAETVELFALVPHSALPDPFPTWTLASAREAIDGKDDTHPMYKTWLQDQEMFLRGALEIQDRADALAFLRGERETEAAKYRIYGLCCPVPKVFTWIPLQLREEGKRRVGLVEVRVDQAGFKRIANSF